MQGSKRLSQLKNLDLNYIDSKNASNLLQSLGRFSTLKRISFRGNNVTITGPGWRNLSNLERLILDNSYVNKDFLQNIQALTSLKVLSLRNCSISGSLPNQGSIPPCLGNMVFEATGNIELSELSDEWDFLSTIPHTDLLALYWQDGPSNLVVPMIYVQDEVNFASKNRYESYMGKIVGFMSGIDLSCNQLIGELPLEIGNLSKILALNFSHNKLSGSIPTEFSNLMMLESLDLSYNNLTGTIPPQLIKLTSLEVFSIAYNNLSGKTPARKDQFGTFEENSYEGNPYLCGPPLKNSCWKIEPTLSLPRPHKDEEEDTEFIDMGTFKTSFMGSYTTMLFGIFTILYLNPYWRRTWFYLVEICITTIYYYLVDLFWGFCMF
ncbi:Non-specific serine/threonine protein kinase [Bertholletia excelsa]